MAKLARVGDMCAGTCNAHTSPRSWTGAILTGASGYTIEGQNMARVGDTGNTDCGHHFVITGGSSIASVNGVGLARTGDTVSVVEGGFGTIIGGASTTDCA